VPVILASPLNVGGVLYMHLAMLLVGLQVGRALDSEPVRGNMPVGGNRVPALGPYGTVTSLRASYSTDFSTMASFSWVACQMGSRRWKQTRRLAQGHAAGGRG
jgi:hypothetical protein